MNLIGVRRCLKPRFNVLTSPLPRTLRPRVRKRVQAPIPPPLRAEKTAAANSVFFSRSLSWEWGGCSRGMLAPDVVRVWWGGLVSWNGGGSLWWCRASLLRRVSASPSGGGGGGGGVWWNDSRVRSVLLLLLAAL